MTSLSHPQAQPRNIYNHTNIKFLSGQNKLILNSYKTTCTLFTPDPAEYTSNMDLKIHNAPKCSCSYLRPKPHTHPQHLSTCTQTSTNHKRNMLGCHFHNTPRQVSYIFASCENINKGKILWCHFHFNRLRQVLQILVSSENINKRKILGQYFHFNRSRQVLQTFMNYEDINKENAIRGLLSCLHPRITHYNRIIIEYNG